MASIRGTDSIQSDTETMNADTVPTTATPVSVLRGRIRLRDLAVLGIVPAVLLGVFGLPIPRREALALDYGAPTLLTIYTSHFVHFSAVHLLANLVGYLLVVLAAYLVAVASNRRRQFFVVFGAFIFAVPVALSGLNLVFPRSTVAVGFSGVIMAFVGYLAFALANYLGTWLEVPVDGRRSRWLFFFGLGLVAIISTPLLYGIPLALAATLSAVLCLLPILEDLAADPDRMKRAMGRAGALELGGLGFVIFGIFPFIAFPSNVSVAAGTVNLYSHLLGYCLGYVATYATLLAGGFEAD